MHSNPVRVEPGPGQESVWDYPRPPRLEKVADRLRVEFAAQTLADTRSGYRILETSHPPVYYFPPKDIDLDKLIAEPAETYCEYKGMARYWTLQVGKLRSTKAAWSYTHPSARYQEIAGYLAFYPSRVDHCWVSDEPVTAQPGDFYGGWITSRVVGPFKGGRGTLGW